MGMQRRSIFLDRDGTINVDSGYLCKSENWLWLPGALDGIAAFNKAGWLVIVASNQSGIARGYYGPADLVKLENFVNGELEKHQARIDDWFYCPHLPEISGNCPCRKPEPGLLLAAARKWNIDLKNSWMIGDRLRDVRAGLAAGTKSALIANDPQTGEALKCSQLYPDVPVWPNLAVAARNIISASDPAIP